MKILALTPELPWPTDQGGRIRTQALLRFLSNRHDVHLLSVFDTAIESKPRPKWTSTLRSVRTVIHPQSAIRVMCRLSQSVLLRRPYVVFKHGAYRLRPFVQAAVERIRPDVVLVEFHYLAPAVKGVQVARVVDMHNVDAILYARFAQDSPSIIRRRHAAIQAQLMRSFEADIPPSFEACVTVSELDRQRLRSLSPAGTVNVVPNGVDVASFLPVGEIATPTDILYLGSLDYEPNADAAKRLISDIMPRVWERRPETTLTIVGRSPSNRLKALASSRVRVIGDPADVKPYIRAARVAAMPLAMGSGSRIKALEIGALAKPMVGSTVAFEGLDLRSDIEALIRDDVTSFASALLNLLEQPVMRERIGNAARNHIVANFSWDASGEKMEQTLRLAQSKSVQ